LLAADVAPLAPSVFFRPEPHILLFRRALGTDPVSGKVIPEQAEAARQAYYREYGVEEHK
jgi:hypothetical protein